jgi:hypothetical protein
MKRTTDSCPLCGAEMIDGHSIDRHHLIPKSKKGVERERCHVVCHRKIHSTLTESELSTYWHTWERLRAHEEITKYTKWVRKQFSRDSEFVDVHRDTHNRNRKRKR